MDDLTASLAAAYAMKMSVVESQVGVKLVKQDEAMKADLVAMIGSSLPDDPSRGRNLNATA